MADYILNRPLMRAERERMELQNKYNQEARADSYAQQARYNAEMAGVKEGHRLALLEDDRRRAEELNDKQRAELKAIDEELIAIDSQMKALKRNLLNYNYPPPSNMGPNAVKNTQAFNDRFARRHGLTGWQADKPAMMSTDGFAAWLKKKAPDNTQILSEYNRAARDEIKALENMDSHQIAFTRLAVRQGSILGRQKALFQKLDYVDYDRTPMAQASVPPPEVGAGLQTISTTDFNVLNDMQGQGGNNNSFVKGQLEGIVGQRFDKDDAKKWKSPHGTVYKINRGRFSPGLSEFHSGISEYFGEDLEDTFGGTTGNYYTPFAKLNSLTTVDELNNLRLEDHKDAIGRAKDALNHYMYEYEELDTMEGTGTDKQAWSESSWLRTDAGDDVHAQMLFDAKRTRYYEAWNALTDRETRLDNQIKRNVDWHRKGRPGITLGTMTSVPDLAPQIGSPAPASEAGMPSGSYESQRYGALSGGEEPSFDDLPMGESEVPSDPDPAAWSDESLSPFDEGGSIGGWM